MLIGAAASVVITLILGALACLLFAVFVWVRSFARQVVAMRTAGRFDGSLGLALDAWGLRSVPADSERAVRARAVRRDAVLFLVAIVTGFGCLVALVAVLN